ncbi:TrkH family potassium uptake protein [Hyphomonas oceanitis]|uniref:TrkH family potassium uptake protein n=1 Tax=Hyphomonas oceanitis TaxID=81033 RepID=UPI003001C632
MPEARVLDVFRRSLLETHKGARAMLLRINPAKLLVFGYVFYMLIGWALLSLPFMQNVPVRQIDNLFTAVSAVSTTGLVTVDPGSTYNIWGQIVILLLIQAGGVGYMTIGSFAMLATHERLTPIRERVTMAAFSLPNGSSPAQFVRTVILFTLICELVGAIALYAIFASEGISNPVWSAIFHSVSAFCTAGFSLNSNSFEGLAGHPGLNFVISVLSLFGAMGFLIIWDIWRNLTGRSVYLGFTSKLIIRMTAAFLLIGTIILFVAEPSIAALDPLDRLLAAFFQTMSASTTVGFNTVPIGALSHATLLVMFFLMAIGASPSGTGGGIKTTSFAAMVGLVRSTLKQRAHVRLFKRRIAASRLQAAGATFFYFMILLTLAMFLLSLTEPGAAFEVMVFECISALGTVGISMGLTGDLSVLGKLIIIILMTAGRVGILSFGIAFAMHDETPAEEADNELLL